MVVVTVEIACDGVCCARAEQANAATPATKLRITSVRPYALRRSATSPSTEARAATNSGTERPGSKRPALLAQSGCPARQVLPGGSGVKRAGTKPVVAVSRTVEMFSVID